MFEQLKETTLLFSQNDLCLAAVCPSYSGRVCPVILGVRGRLWLSSWVAGILVGVDEN